MEQTMRATLMSRDVEIARIEGRQLYPLREELMPLYLRRTGNLEEWLAHRAIDRHRTHSRLLKKVLRLSEKDDASTALAMQAATITDTYWVRPAGSDLTWDKVRFRENYFDTLALQGDLSAFSRRPSRTPELTNIGSFEKCWRLEDGRWWMYKQCNENEMFSELFVYELCKALGFPTAYYEKAGPFIRTLDFTAGKVNFEPAFSLVGEEEDYGLNYRIFKEISPAMADDYLQLLMMDAFCLNADRHTENYGVLRDIETGGILSLAPNFDNNISLLYDGYKPQQRMPDLLGRELNDLERTEHALSEYAAHRPLPMITPELIEECCRRTEMKVDVPYVQQFVMAGYRQTLIPQMLQEQARGLEP